MRLLLIRHGQTPANVRGSLDTAAPGPGLTDLGRRQADAVPHALHGQSLQGIYASRLIRTRLTAAPLARDRRLDVVVRPGLHEIEAGDFEGKTDETSVKGYLGTMLAWAQGDLDVTMPGAHDGHEFFGRFDGAIEQIEAETAAAAAVFSHGAAIRSWVGSRAVNISSGFTLHNPLDNTGVAVLDGSVATGWTLVSWAGTPVGGDQLHDATAPDPTGEGIAR